MTDNAIDTTKKEGQFMLPIWVITGVTMLGTLFLCYSYHLYEINKKHSANMEQVEAINFRTNKYTEYRDILKKDGKDAAYQYLNRK